MGEQHTSTPAKQGTQSQESAEKGGTAASLSEAGRSAGQLASGPPPAVEREAVQRSYGRQAAAPPPAAPQTRGRQPE